MNFSDLLDLIPGVNKLNVKYLVEATSMQVIKHVGHKVERYTLFIPFKDVPPNFVSGWAIFVIQHPGPIIPETYKPPMNLVFKGIKRNVPEGGRMYDMDLSNGMDTIREFLSRYLDKNSEGKDIDFIQLEVDRNSKEIPCTTFYTVNGEKKKETKILK